MTKQLPDQLTFSASQPRRADIEGSQLPLERIPEPGHKTRPVDVRGSLGPVNTGAVLVVCVYLIESVKLCLVSSM